MSFLKTTISCFLTLAFSVNSSFAIEGRASQAGTVRAPALCAVKAREGEEISGKIETKFKKFVMNHLKRCKEKVTLAEFYDRNFVSLYENLQETCTVFVPKIFNSILERHPEPMIAAQGPLTGFVEEGKRHREALNLIQEGSNTGAESKSDIQECHGIRSCRDDLEKIIKNSERVFAEALELSQKDVEAVTIDRYGSPMETEDSTRAALQETKNLEQERTTKAVDYNQRIVRAIREMPKGGGYSLTAATNRAAAAAIGTNGDGVLTVNPKGVSPSHCTSATYILFTKVVADTQVEGVELSPESVDRMLVKKQLDGEDVWGRWNSNGPGTSKLFHDLDLGSNTTNWNEAKPGDFMKIYWNNSIGKDERAHSVVYLGTETGRDGSEYVRFWSSNQSTNGMGIKSVPRDDVKYAIFSRLERPENLVNATELPKRDDFLSSMLKRNSSQVEVKKVLGIK